MNARPTVKPLTFDSQTLWTIFKTQFDVVSSAKGSTDRMKASQLVASLRGSAAEVLQIISADKLIDLTTIEKALESRFGDNHPTQLYRTELKIRRQNPGENLQHHKGTTHGNKDALAQRLRIESCEYDLNTDKKFGTETDISVRELTMTTEDTWSSNDIQKAQLEDPDIRPILKKKLNLTD
ncbi:hypothetical protein AVEN_116715-1 [Araneus ventricosus]|uniref:Uncharacterized protein n=1 Tax=Araneus ventricosus TaxID=182803 RepID=A0A4Y2EL22_ARAVE|nr:hypothetical protein AVEN_116715-1 [Araneus ventricosus]